MLKFEKSRIKQLRENLGLTQLELARMLGYSRQNVKHWEDGECKPGVDKIAHICDTCDVETSYFFVDSLACKQDCKGKTEDR